MHFTTKMSLSDKYVFLCIVLLPTLSWAYIISVHKVKITKKNYKYKILFRWYVNIFRKNEPLNNLYSRKMLSNLKNRSTYMIYLYKTLFSITNNFTNFKIWSLSLFKNQILNNYVVVGKEKRACLVNHPPVLYRSHRSAFGKKEYYN